MTNATKQKSTSDKARRDAPRSAGTYHGIRIAAPRDTEHFSVKEIRRAVDNAIAKNSSIFTTRK